MRGFVWKDCLGDVRIEKLNICLVCEAVLLPVLLPVISSSHVTHVIELITSIYTQAACCYRQLAIVINNSFEFHTIMSRQLFVCICQMNYTRVSNEIRLSRNAMQARPMLSCGVRLSICLSRSCILSKSINTFLFFSPYHTSWQYFDWNPAKRGGECRRARQKS